MKFLAALFLACLAFTPANAQFSGQFFTKIAGQPTWTIDYFISDSVENAKTKIQDKTGIDIPDMALFYNAQQMLDGHTLEDYGMINETFIYVYPALRPTALVGDVVWEGDTSQSVSFADYAAGALSVSSFEIDGLLDLTGLSTFSPVTLSLATTTFGVPVALQNFNPAVSAVWTWVSTTEGIDGYTPGAFNIDTAGFLSAPSEGQFSIALSENGNNLNLVYAVPEPSTYALIIVGLLSAIVYLRRRRGSANEKGSCLES
ncbi:MAG: ubiquitin-like protein [Chthoniobacterales bacterium]